MSRKHWFFNTFYASPPSGSTFWFLRSGPSGFRRGFGAPPLIMHHEAEWRRMSCAGQVLARFAARSRSFHLVAAAIGAHRGETTQPSLRPRTRRVSSSATPSPRLEVGSTDSPQSADLVRAYEAFSIRVGQGDRNFWKQFPEKSWNATD